MRTQKMFVFYLLMFVALIALSACTRETTTPTEPPKITEPAVKPTNSPYPVPSQDVFPLPSVTPIGPYPPAEVGPESTLASPVLYPDIKDGAEITWNQAIALLYNGEVSKVIQSSSLKVTLLLKDGRTLITTEPALDDVVKAIQTCGAPCQEIEVVTE